MLNNSRTRAAKARAQEEYTAVDREVKRSIKKDKRDYIDDLARQAETAAGQGNLRDLYLVTKKLTGKFQQTDKPVMDKNGNPLTTTNEQLKRCFVLSCFALFCSLSLCLFFFFLILFRHTRICKTDSSIFQQFRNLSQ